MPSLRNCAACCQYSADTAATVRHTSLLQYSALPYMPYMCRHPLQISLGKADAKYIYARGNLAALRWLHRRGLLDCCSVSWLAGRVELGVAPAAAGGVEHGAGVLVGANASRDGVGPVEVVAGTGGALGRIAKWVHWVWRVGGAADRWTPAAGSGWCHWWPRVAYG